METLCERLQFTQTATPCPGRDHAGEGKNGELSVLYAGGDRYAHGLVDMAEALSAHVCEVCGAPGQLSEGDVLRTRCTEHR